MNSSQCSRARNAGDNNQNWFRDFLETKQHSKGNRRDRCVPHGDLSALVKNVTTSTFVRHTELFLTKNSESSARNPAMGGTLEFQPNRICVGKLVFGPRDRCNNAPRGPTRKPCHGPERRRSRSLRVWASRVAFERNHNYPDCSELERLSAILQLSCLRVRILVSHARTELFGADGQRVPDRSIHPDILGVLRYAASLKRFRT